METGKPGLASAPVHISSVLAQTEKRMDVQAPLTAVYIHTVPALSTQPYPQPPAVAREPAALHLAMPPLYSKETPTFLTLHIAGSLQSQPGFSLTAAAPAARPKSAGKHVCLHCGRDCMKPSVLEKHLRCHTGERPYPCTTCGVSFKTQSNLYKHKRTQAHARLSSESEQSSLGSQDSMSSSRETCTSSLSLDEQSEGSGSLEKDATFPAAEITCSASTYKVYSVKKQGPVSENNELTTTGHKTEPNESAEITKEEEKQRMESEKPPLTLSRHLPLQRQQATLFSKQWESSVSRGKSQNHESTDSGFSESSDHYPSPGSIIPDHSMDSLAESTKEHLEEPSSTCAPSEPGQGGQEPKDTAREQEQKTLEERISKLISENTAVVEDKHLENVRPRKTVLSKQGSIDLPLPYTYKDSFHFDMRISKTPNVGLQRNRNPGLYSSVPTQHSSTVDHTPVTRSNSLPFSVTLLQPERSSPTSSYQNDYVTLIRRGSSGQINPTGFAIKPVNQQSSTHRPLVRQTAVDCNHATDALFMNSSVEEACAGSLSCDGDGGDICGEPSNRKFRRKKAQKFAYNKWHMYGGGTFKKLYNADKVGDNGAIKGRKSTNPEHEVVQSLQKKLSAVYKETVTTTSSTINVTSSSATVCHLGCPPAKQSGVDLNLKTGQLHSTCTSLKTPVRRNLSSPTLPLSSIGSVTHKTDGMSGTNAGRLINEEKHTDSTLQLCGAHIPSDRKKLRTDEKIICPVEMEINPNTMTHPPPSVTGCVPQQDTNLSYVNIQTNQKHSQLQGALFPPCIINANVPSVCTSLVTSTPPAAKTSFLPKYQLKLPNAAEPDSNDTLPAVDKPPGNDRCTLPSVLSSSHVEQTSSSVTTSENKCSEPVTSPSMQTCDKNKKTNGYSPLQGQIHLPERLRLDQNTTSNLAVVHRPFAGSTITTTCLQSYQAGLCSTSVQSLPVAPVVKNVAATPIITTEHNQSSAAPSPASGQLNSANRANAASNTPIVPCHIVPFNSVQPAGQNVFHVHTADLQICLQIISDEQLALIEPQIEQQAVSSVSPRHDMEAVASETIQTRAQKSVLMDDTDEQRDYEQPGHQKDSDQSESLPNLNTENIKPPLSVQVLKAQPDLHMTKHSDPTQATVSAESKPPEALGLPLHPHKQGHVNMVTETQSCTGDVMLTAASLKGVTTGRSSEEHALPLNSCAEEQTHSGQNKLNMTSHFPNAINQTSMKNELLGKESRHKLKHLGGAPKAKGIDFACEIETCLPWASGNMCADELSGTVSIISTDKWKTPRQSNPQVSTCWSNLAESTLSETLVSSKHANMGYHRVGPLQEMTLSESQGGISSAHSEKQQGLFTSTSSNIQMEKPKDIQAVLTSIQSPTTAQKEPQTRGHGGTHGQPDWRPKQSQEAEETNHQCMEEQQGSEVTVGENESREMSGINADEVPGQWETGKVESNCRYTVLPDMVIPEGEDRRVKADSSWLSEQHLQHLSRTPSGMSDYPPQSPQQAPNTLNNLNSSASSSQTSLFNPPQPPSEMINFYFSQLQHWDSRFSHNEETPNSSQCTAPDLLIETQTSLPQTETFSHQDQNPTLSAHQRNTTAGNDSAAECCCNKSTLGSHKSPSQDVKIPSSTHLSQVFHPVHVSKVTAGLTGDTQATKSNVLDNNTVQPSLTFMYTEPDNKADTKDRAPHDYTSQSSNSGRADITSKYQSLFLAGQLHSCQPLDCLTSGVRPVQSCQDYTEDTSSSDDEGKLIIEL